MRPCRCFLLIWVGVVLGAVLPLHGAPDGIVHDTWELINGCSFQGTLVQRGETVAVLRLA